MKELRRGRVLSGITTGQNVYLLHDDFYLVGRLIGWLTVRSNENYVIQLRTIWKNVI